MKSIAWENLIYIGPLYPKEQEGEILRLSKQKGSSAPNVFQWNLLSGLHDQLGHGVQIVNALPVGTWPRQYRKAVLPDRAWQNEGAPCREVGCPNLPVVKQLARAARTRRLLKQRSESVTEIILYSAYMPFLKAISKLPKSVRVTAIITDLPEYYDLGQTSRLRKCLRKMQNKLIDRYMRRVDRFVLLTQAMHEPLSMGDRPWLLMEGVCRPTAHGASGETPKRAILYTGTLHYQYGIGNLLKAFEGIHDDAVSLWICGSGEAESEIKELAKRDSRVTFWGFCDQARITQLRQSAEILVNPRPNEGEYTKYSFPSKTMEYMESGKPVVMYPLEGVPREYDPYLYYASENTPEALRQTIEYVLCHPAEAAQKGESARAFVTNEKNPARQAQRLLQFLEQTATSEKASAVAQAKEEME